MKVVSFLAVSTLAIAIAPSCLADAGVFLLRHRGSSLVIERQPLESAKPIELRQGVDGFVALILPVGPGGSGSILQAAMAGVTTVELRDDSIIASTTAGGRRFDHPARSLAELAKQDIHLSAHSADGATIATFIRGYASVEPDPVNVNEDIFAGRVPLNAGDCVVYTNTFVARSNAEPLEGELPVVFDGQHHRATATLAGAGQRSTVVDLAAGASVIAKSALPDGVTISSTSQTQYSADGVRTMSSEVGAATGAAEPLGVAVLPSVKIGAVEFINLEVLVLQSLPTSKTGPIEFILGLDVLSRASSVSFPYPKTPDTLAPIILGKPGDARTPRPGDFVAPISFLGSATYTAGKVNGVETLFILDNGSGFTILDAKSAKAAHVDADPAEATVLGASGAKSAIHHASAKSITLAGHDLADLPVMVGALPIFQKTRGQQNPAIMGNSVLSRFSRVEIDFDQAQLRLIP